MTQGRYANKSGKVLEKTVIGSFTERGFVMVSHSKWIKNPQKYGAELLLTNVPFTTIYQHTGRTEFLVRSQRYDLNMRIECKWQQSSGSVDEKFPYLYLNCIEAMPEKQIIVIVAGRGFKKGSVEWLKQAVADRRYATPKSTEKMIQVFNLEEFISWANTALR